MREEQIKICAEYEKNKKVMDNLFSELELKIHNKKMYLIKEITYMLWSIIFFVVHEIFLQAKKI